MDILITGIDTNNNDLVNEFINVIREFFPQYSSLSVLTTDTTLEIVGSI